jgi:hypothetical protein
LYSIGLFQFLPVADKDLKYKIMQILNNFYYPLGEQLVPCASALIGAMLGGLDETDEEFFKCMEYLGE